MFIKPASPLVSVLDPITYQPLPAEGREVDDGNVYWTRQILCGDVVKMPSPVVAVDQISDSAFEEK